MTTGAIFSNVPGGGNALNVSGLVAENENNFPAVKKLNQDIHALREKKQAVTDLLELSREERMDGLKKGNRPLYDEIHRVVDAREHSIAFRIWAGTTIGAAAAGIGLVAAAVYGVNVGILGTIAFPATLVLGTCLSRLYRAASKKWIAPGKEDALAVKIFKEYGQKFDEKIPQLEQKKVDVLKRITDSNQQFADAATGSREQDAGISKEEEFIDIGGVKLKVNQKLELITIPPVVIKYGKM